MAQEDKIIPERWRSLYGILKAHFHECSCDEVERDWPTSSTAQLIEELGTAESALATQADEMKRLRETLAWVLDDLQEWCDAVTYDPSWDGWDSHYKSFAHGGIAKARAALSPQEPQDGEKEVGK